MYLADRARPIQSTVRRCFKVHVELIHSGGEERLQKAIGAGCGEIFTDIGAEKVHSCPPLSGEAFSLRSAAPFESEDGQRCVVPLNNFVQERLIEGRVERGELCGQGFKLHRFGPGEAAQVFEVHESCVAVFESG